jgi:NAD-dependent dihydropyrimidine dehydrogenase PreA subunit
VEVLHGICHCRTLHRNEDTACVDACPVDFIHPKKNTTYEDGRPGLEDVPQLYIDPVECIDCGACVPAPSPQFLRSMICEKNGSTTRNARKLR